MKAILYKGKIQTYMILPLELGLTSGIRMLSDTAIYDMGFRDVVTPSITQEQYLGEIFMDEINDVYTYPVIDKTQEEIDTEFSDKKTQAIYGFERDTDELIRSVVGERSSEYEIAEQEAIAYKAAGYPDIDVPPSISSDAIANNRTNTEACDLILFMADNWRNMQIAVRANRLLAKANSKSATTLEELQTVIDTWNGFISYIKTQIVE